MRGLLILVFLVGCSIEPRQSENETAIGANSPAAISELEFIGDTGDIFVFATLRFSGDEFQFMALNLRNGAGRPIELNYFADRFYLIDAGGRPHRLENEKDYLGATYPDGVINPGGSKTFSVFAPKVTLKKWEIKFLKIKIGLEKIIIFLRPAEV